MALTAYLDLDGFKDRTTMPPGDVDSVESRRPGYIAKRLLVWTSEINATLAKRYKTPVAQPPEVLLGWLADLVTLDAYKARGFNPGAEQDDLIEKAATRALERLTEVANGEKGLIELPLLEGAVEEADAVTKGSPLGYSEVGPYEWVDVQAEALDG